jgi:tight adherence protein B
MGLVVLGFLAILAASFGLVIAMIRPSPEEKTIERRMALIRMSSKNLVAVNTQAEQLFKATRTGRFGRLEELLGQFNFGRSLHRRILQSNSTTTAGTLILTSFGLLLAGYAITWLFAPMFLVDLVAGVILSLLPYLLLSFKRNRRISAFNATLAEAIDMLARALRAGHSVVGAMGMLAESAEEPAASEFGEVFKQQNLGLPMRDALLQLLERVPSPDLRVLVTAILVQKDTGGNLAEILDRTVFVIRERLRIQGEIQTQTAQGRLTGWILSSLPIAMALLLNLVNPGYSSILLTDPLGRKLIYVCCGMLALGTFFIRRIVNGIEV